MLEFLVPYSKFAKYVFALGALLSLAVGIIQRNMGFVFTGYGTAINFVLVLLGTVLAVLCFKNKDSNNVLLGALGVIVLNLVFPLIGEPIAQVTALGGGGALNIGTGEVVPFIGVRLTISLLTVFLAPAAGLLGLKAIYKAVK